MCIARKISIYYYYFLTDKMLKYLFTRQLFLWKTGVHTLISFPMNWLSQTCCTSNRDVSTTPNNQLNVRIYYE